MNLCSIQFYIKTSSLIYSVHCWSNTFAVGSYVVSGVRSHAQRRKAWWRNQMETLSTTCHFCGGIHRSTVNSPSQRPVTRALMISLFLAWTNGRVNNRDAGDLRRHRIHCDVIVMDWKMWCCMRSYLQIRYECWIPWQSSHQPCTDKQPPAWAPFR